MRSRTWPCGGVRAYDRSAERYPSLALLRAHSIPVVCLGSMLGSDGPRGPDMTGPLAVTKPRSTDELRVGGVGVIGGGGWGGGRGGWRLWGGGFVWGGGGFAAFWVGEAGL